MKTIYITLITISAGFLSCVDLVEEPKAEILATGFFRNLSDLETANAGMYRRIINNANPWEVALTSTRFRAAFCAADDFTSRAGSNKADWLNADIFAFRVTPIAGRMGQNIWKIPWSGILQANWIINDGGAFLETLDAASTEEGQEIIAEAYFWRAWCYFYLVRMFGPVPIIQTNAYDPSVFLNIQSEHVESVYNFIERDIQYAIDHARPATVNDRQSRITREAALAFMAEYALTRAGWPLKQTNYYQIALDNANEVINGGKFTLFPSFYELFDEVNEENSEYIWQLHFCVDGCIGTGGNVFGQKGSKPAEIGQGFADLFVEKTFGDNFPPGPRKDRSLVSTYKAELDGEVVDLTFSVDRPFFSKYWGTSYDSSALGSTQPRDAFSSLDWPMIRLAEVYMIAAEAQAMATGAPSAQSYEYVNMIRRRGAGIDMNVAAPAVDLPAGLSAAQFQDEIFAERGWEFLGEMQRWFDLTRLEKVAEVTANRHPDELTLANDAPTPGDGLSIGDPYYYLKPIQDIVLNPNLEKVNSTILTFE